MALAEKLELLINADPSQGVAAMERFAKATDKYVTASESSLKRLSSAATKIGVAGIGVGGLLTQMASEDIEAANQLKAAIGQVGQSYDEFAGRIDDAASAQAHFGHTDDEVAGAITTLTLAYNDTNKALDELQLVSDLAARKHISLADAAGQVAKAHGGSGRIFKEFGIEVGTAADGTKDFDGALGQLAQKLSGQAAASADTFGGKLEELKANASNMASEFGQKFGPAILGVSTAVTALGPVATAAAKGMSALSTSSALSSAGFASIAGPAGLAVAGLAALAFSSDDVGRAQSDAAVKVGDLTDALRAQGADGLERVNKEIAETLTTAADFPHVFEDAHASLGPFIDEVRNGGEELHILQRAGVANIDGMGKFVNLMHSGQLAATPFNNELLRLAESGTLTREQWVQMVIVLNEGSNAFSSATDQANLLTYAQDQVTGSSGKTKKALDDQAKAVENLGKMYQSVIDGTLSTFEAELALSDARIASRKAVEDLTKARREGKVSDDEGLKLTNDTFEAILREAKANEDLAVSLATGKTETEKAQIAQSALVTELYSVASTLDPASDLHQRLVEYITKLQGVPSEVQTHVNLDSDEAIRALQELQRELAGVTGDTEISFFANRGGGSQARAMGGSGLPNGSYFIEPGTHGEFFTPSNAGHFTPLDKMGGSQPAGHTFVLAGNAEEQAYQVSRRLRIDAMLEAA